MFHHLAQLPSQFYPTPVGPSRIRQTVEHHNSTTQVNPNLVCDHHCHLVCLRILQDFPRGRAISPAPGNIINESQLERVRETLTHGSHVHVLCPRGLLEPRGYGRSVQGTEVKIVAQASTEPNRIDPLGALIWRRNCGNRGF